MFALAYRYPFENLRPRAWLLPDISAPAIWEALAVGPSSANGAALLK